MKISQPLPEVCDGRGQNSEQALLAFPAGDNKWFALPLTSVEAVLGADSLCPLEGESGVLVGYVQLRGWRIPTLDVSGLLGLASPGVGPRQVILLRAGTSWAALAVAGTSETVSISSGDMRWESGSGAATRCAMGVYQADGRAITVLNPDWLLAHLQAD